MKRTICFVLITLLLLSMVPGALAQDVEIRKNEKGDIVVENKDKTIENAEKVSLGEQKQVLIARIKALPQAERIKEIMTFKAEQLREFQKQRLMTAVEKCDEEKDQEKCKEKLEKRVELVNKLREKDLEVLQKLVQRTLERTKELREIKESEGFKRFKEEGFKARKLAEEKIKDAERMYKNAKDKLEKVKIVYEEKKDEISKLREELKDLAGEEYKAKEKEIKLAAKEFLVKISDIITSNLDKLRSKVESSETLTSEEASELLAKIDNAKQKIEEIKVKINELTAESTKEDVKNLASELREAWKEVKKVMNENVGRLMNSKIGGIIIKSKQLETKLARVLEKMVEQGKDTSVVSPLVEQFNAKLSEAKTNYESALESFKIDVQKGQGYMKKAHAALKEANVILRNIFFELKKQNAEKELENETSEAEEKAEEELEE